MLVIAIWVREASCDARVGTILAAWASASGDILHLLVILALLLAMLAAMGHLLLGVHMKPFSGFLQSVGACFSCLVAGDLSGINVLVRACAWRVLPPAAPH